MRIVERYSTGMRVFLGRGRWGALRPIRNALALCHGLCRRGGADRTRKMYLPRAAGDVRIVSVGNLESGGTGKTPCVLALACELRRRAARPVVVSGGYGGKARRQGRPVVAAPPDGIERGRAAGALIWEDADTPPGAAEAQPGTVSFLGDEACLYLRHGLAVVIDRDRGRAINAAARILGPTHILLDDAFHRRELHKDLDILLLDHRRPFGEGRLLPGGTLREPARAVRRAGAVLFTRAAGRSIPEAARTFVEGKPVFFSRHVAAGLYERSGAPVDPLSFEGRPLALFSGVARPDSFEALAWQAGLAPLLSIRFDDHRRYTPRDVAFIIEQAGKDAVLVTTAKDWVRVAALVPPGIELLRLDMRMEIDDIERLLGPVAG